jgi:hypothetical protein
VFNQGEETIMEPKRLFPIIAGLAAMTAAPGWSAEDEPLGVSFDGLTLIEHADADVTYVLPEADFSLYNRFMIMEPEVAFRRNWQRDVNRGTRSPAQRVNTRDMERIKSQMSELFLEVFTQELTNGGFMIVEEPDEDVLILRPAIVNLDVAAPNTQTANRTQTFVANAGSASLFIELYDSLTGQILARAVDSRSARTSSAFQWASSVTNRAEARNALRIWARTLVDSLNEVRERETVISAAPQERL